MRAEHRGPAALARGARSARTLRAALWVTLALHAAGCGEDIRLGAGRQAPDADAPDAALPQDAGSDAAISGPRWNDPVQIAELSIDGDAADDDPSLSVDRKLLFFNSEREGGLGQEDIWASQRAAAEDRWGAPEPVEGLNSAQRETGIALSADGLAIFWSSDRDGGAGGLDVYAASRDSRDAAWSAPQRIEALSSADDDLVSALADAGRSVLLARRAPDEDYDLLVARRVAPDQPFEAPQPIAELNSDEEESDAFLVGGATQLLFTRDEDLQLAERGSPGGVFGEPVALDTLNSGDDDRDAWASDDLGYVVFSSDRGGSYRLYEARR